MRPEFVKLMKCPYCGSDFRVGDMLAEKEGEVIHGFVSCECGEFPILDGILNLNVASLNSRVAKLLREGKAKEAVAFSLGKYAASVWQLLNFQESRGICGQAARRIVSGLVEAREKRAYRKYSDINLTFYDLLGGKDINLTFYDLLGGKSFNAYLKHRFSTETFWSLYPFIPILKKKNERILDLGCGAGHASFIISTYVKPQQLVCADMTFSNLYLAKKYFAKNAEFICLDANYPLPFKDGIFSSILMLDAFHYVHARASLASEMERMLHLQGFLLLLHLHNSINYNPVPGNPLSPSNWVSLFQQLPIKALPEGNLVEDFILRNTLDLTKKYTEAELNSSNALSLIGTRDKSVLRIYEEVGRDFLSNKSNLIINPIYSIKRTRYKLTLRRNFPRESFRREYPLTERYLPEKYIIEGRFPQFMQGAALNIPPTEISEKDLHHIEDLMRRFIVINVPQSYY